MTKYLGNTLVRLCLKLNALFIAPPPSHLSAGGRRGRPSYQKNGRARNRQRPLAAIVCLRAHDKTLKVLEGPPSLQIALLSTVGPRPFRSNVHRGLFSPDVGARHRAGPAERIARSRSPAHGASRPPHRAGRTQHTRRPAAQTPPQFKPWRHAGVTSSSASQQSRAHGQAQ